MEKYNSIKVDLTIHAGLPFFVAKSSFNCCKWRAYVLLALLLQ